MNRPEYYIAGAYDIETTTVETEAGPQAFPCLYICNDLTRAPVGEYVPGERERIELFRYRSDVLDWIERLISDGLSRGAVPVVCAYNMMFDLAPLMGELASLYQCEVCAQSSTHVYTLDLVYDGTPLLRFWDTFYLEMGGLAAMGRTCGVAKAEGDWDYTLIRSPETELTADEIRYASRDVQVIPAYLRYLVEANEWLDSSMLGCSVLTKTSLVRQMGRRVVGRMRVEAGNGKRETLRRLYLMNAEAEAPRNFASWALRRACFRGGLTFTAANRASQVHRDCVSLDVTSMHHMYINGVYIPRGFRAASLDAVRHACERTVSVPVSEVLAHLYRPLPFGLNVRVRFHGLRLRAGTVFEREGIATLATGKLTRSAPGADWGTEAGKIAEECARSAGWMDRGFNVSMAFSKVMSAEWIEVHLTELELWVCAQVYEWDSMDVVCGELAQNWVRPPDYVALQSHMLFEAKDEMKRLCSEYSEGVPYTGPIGPSVPDHIADGIRSGTLPEFFVRAYYQSTVKGMFNSIYGVEAQNTLKPDYYVTPDGEITVDQSTVPSAANWAEVSGDVKKVWYTYGTRIVGGSRLHLVLALILLGQLEGCAITGGDTDSVKLCGPMTDGDIMEALAPLHDAARRALDVTGARVRECHPELASDLAHVGEFDIEDCAGHSRYPLHWEAWNKARMSLDADGRAHVTCAGLPRPPDAYHIERWADDMMGAGASFEECAGAVLGYNATVDYSVCRYLQRDHPRPWDRFRGTVTDWRGDTWEVDAPRAIALFPGSRDLGDEEKLVNRQNMDYLRSIGVKFEERPRTIGASREGGEWSPWIAYDEEFYI